jgi:hypothetical protein
MCLILWLISDLLTEVPWTYLVVIYQTTLDPETSDRTAFSTHDGKSSFRRVPFGLCGAVQFVQMIMQRVLRGLTQPLFSLFG